MFRTNGWVNALFALVFIAVPAMIGFYFLLPDWNHGDHKMETWKYYVIALGFIGYSFLLFFLLIKFEILGMDSLNFNIPITFVFAVIFVSSDWHAAIRVVVAVLAIASALPIMIWTNSYITGKISEMKKKHKKK